MALSPSYQLARSWFIPRPVTRENWIGPIRSLDKPALSGEPLELKAFMGVCSRFDACDQQRRLYEIVPHSVPFWKPLLWVDLSLRPNPPRPQQIDESPIPCEII